MKKSGGLKMKMLIVAVVLMITLSACAESKEKEAAETGASSPSASASAPASSPAAESPSASPSEEPPAAGPREVKTYVDLNFDNLDDGADIPDTASEGAGFKVVKVDGNGWAVSRNPQDWAAIYLGVSDETGTEIFLENFAI